MMVGAVIWMKGLFGDDAGQVASALLAKGTGPVLRRSGRHADLGMGLWWADVVKESQGGRPHPVVAIGLRYGMVLFIASEIMFFAAFFWMFFEMSVFHDRPGPYPGSGRLGRHRQGLVDLAAQGHRGPGRLAAAAAEHRHPAALGLHRDLGAPRAAGRRPQGRQDRPGLTIALGLLFTCVQAYEYHEIIGEKLFFNEEAANSGLYGSIFFMATGFHGFHVLVGTIFLIVCLIRLLNGAFTPKQHFGFEAAAWYWHFVDVVWLFLFAFVYVIFG
jgi:cytochrome c oxidase subunit 3